jgi:hypothetical protein
VETDETLWGNLQKPVFRIKIRQFLYKAMHSTQKIGEYWAHIPGYEHRQDCLTCQVPESMNHIISECRERTVEIVWKLAKDHWPHTDLPWPNTDIGTVLGCGSLSVPAPPQDDTEHPVRPKRKGAIRLLQILVSESAYLIWVLRCERVIQEKTHSEEEIKARWFRAINNRLTDDKITATKIKRDQATFNKVRATWEDVLKRLWDLPNDWIYSSEVLVGRR